MRIIVKYEYAFRALQVILVDIRRVTMRMNFSTLVSMFKVVEGYHGNARDTCHNVSG
jgi:hypothetical protein